jgi:hypothetical protein
MNTRFKILANVAISLLMTIVLSLISCNPINQPTSTTNSAVTISDDPISKARQTIVDTISSLRREHSPPGTSNDSPRHDDWFDVNDYFTVLDHLSMQSGYVLDYFYKSDGSGAYPFLYARKINRKSYDNFTQIRELWGEDPYKYLDYIGTDDTEESYFQFIVLRIIGGKFYIFWHAEYDVRYLVCNHTGLDTLITHLPEEVQLAALQIDIKPEVALNEDTAQVRVVTFNQWIGFVEETYTIRRSFPHTIIDIKQKTIVPYKTSSVL